MSLTGTLGEVDIVNVIELARQSGAPARLIVRRGMEEANLFLEGGEIAHATLGSRIGEEVVIEVLAWQDGSFELEVGTLPPEHTVTTNWSSLLLESLHRIDESAGGWDGVDALFNEDTEHESHKEISKMAKLDDLLKEMSGEIPGFIAADIAGMDGLAIASYSTDADFDTEAASAQFALIMKLVQKTVGQIKIGEVEDTLVTTGSAYVLTRFLGDGTYYLSIAVDKEAASLGNLRLMTREFADDLWTAVPKRRSRK